MAKTYRKIIRFVKSRFEYVSKDDKNRLKKYKQEFPNVLSTSETLHLIKKNNLSIARYGDAEFDICNQENKEDEWQKPSDELTERLCEILEVEEEGFLTCIPPFDSKHNNIKNYYGSLTFWDKYWLDKYEKIRPLLTRKTYGNSFVSRDSVFYENSLEDIMELWNQKKIVFVYGNGGRFEEDSVIFSNAKICGRVLVSPTNAFERYNEILEECIKYPKDILFLISAGPTASVLAYDLYKNGYRALDIGHMPVCYRQYKGEIDSPESIPMVKKEER